MVARVTRESCGSPEALPLIFLTARRSRPLSSAAAITSSRRLTMTLWLLAVMPTRAPWATSSQTMRAPV